MSTNLRAAASAEVSHSSEEKFVMGEVVMVLWMVEREMEVAGRGGRHIGVLGLRASAAAPPRTLATPWVRTRPPRARLI